MAIELLIQNGKKLYSPVVLEDIEWSTERYGSPGKLSFKVLVDDELNITEGNAVTLKYNGTGIFYGFIFTKKVDKTGVMSITAYDQLRYLKNKETYVYENKTAGEVIRMIAEDFRLQTGVIEDTRFKIASGIEDDETLFDIIQNTLDATLTNTRNMYVMFDDYGKISLKNIGSLRVDIVIDEETGENYDYTSTIDEGTFNKVKLMYDNEGTGERDVFVAQNGESMNNWGVLQFTDTIEKGENGKAKAEALLELYNQKTRKLTISNAFGDIRVRAGSLIGVMLDLGDVKLQNYMLVETCKHVFKDSEHLMTLKLRGGEFIG